MNKKILRTLTALCAALMLTGGFSVTAFAQTPEGEDATDDSGVVYEEPQKEEPLTPDGNATLVPAHAAALSICWFRVYLS